MHIRYLVLSPAPDSEDPLCCTLHSAPLDSLPPFEAISYVWGNNQKVAQVSLDDGVIRITASLDGALRRLRLPDAKRTLWADSICIDQANRKEQGNQVALMGKIYAKAVKTIIFLGPDPDAHAENVASLLKEITQRIERQGGSLEDNRFVPELDLHDPLSADPRWSSYRAMVASPWFTRVWTVQEAALGGNPQILWGTTEMPWAQLIGVNQWLLSKARHIWYYMRPWLNDAHGRGFWMLIWPMPNFVEVLARAKQLHCSDERDRIFAFLGSPKALLGENGAVIMRPDYEKNFREVYLDFATAWLETTQWLGLLSAVEHTMETFEEDHPSWVPRWDVPLTNGYFGLYAQGFEASKGLDKTAPEFVSKTRLKLRGIVVDVVRWRSDILPEHMGVEEPTSSILRNVWNYLSGTSSNGVFAAWKHLSLPATKFAYTNRSRLLAFTRTICRQAYGDASPEFHPDEAAFALSLSRRSSRFTDLDIPSLEKDAKGGDIKAFVTHAGIWATFRRLILTGDGHYALAPQITEEDDLCCVISGLPVPVILRKTEEEDCYKLIGEAFVLGMMDGEVLKTSRKGGNKLQDITLC
jgi:hypothetical protein